LRNKGKVVMDNVFRGSGVVLITILKKKKKEEEEEEEEDARVK
jgi:hypothetical protein